MSKSTMNLLSTIIGLIAGFATLLGSTGVVNKEITGIIGGIATAMLGYLIQKPALLPEKRL